MFIYARTDTAGEEIFNDGEESLASEQGRGTDDEETPDVVDMTSAYFNYHSFMDKTPRIKWSKHDTERFYEVIKPPFFPQEFSYSYLMFIYSACPEGRKLSACFLDLVET